MNRREHILQTARALLLEREGAFTVQLLLERSGSSVGSLYHHFGSKDGVLEAVADDVIARYKDALSIALLRAGAGKKAQLKAVVMHHFAFQSQAEEHDVLLRHLHISPAQLLEQVPLEELSAHPAPVAAAILLGPSLVHPAENKKVAKLYARAAWRALS